jgi:hypothetical protein
MTLHFPPIPSRENLFNAIQTYINPFNTIRIYKFPSMPSNLNFNPFNAITVSLELTPSVQFKVNLSNATKIYTDPFNATRNCFDLFGVLKNPESRNMD